MGGGVGGEVDKMSKDENTLQCPRGPKGTGSGASEPAASVQSAWRDWCVKNWFPWEDNLTDGRTSDCRQLMGQDHISTENLVLEKGRDLYPTEIKTYTLVEKLLSLIHLLAQGPERKQWMGTAMPFIQFLTVGACY